MSFVPDNEYYKILHDLQAADFVLVELNLYLDTHPNDENAIRQFNQYSALRKQIALQYEANYGPLLGFGHSQPQDTWQWIEAPWPWQV
jgi:spore coat protein JB